MSDTPVLWRSYSWEEEDGTYFGVEALATIDHTKDLFLVKAYNVSHNIYYTIIKEYWYDGNAAVYFDDELLLRIRTCAIGWTPQQVVDDLDHYVRNEFRDSYYRDRKKEFGF